MTRAALLQGEHHWYCSHCTDTSVTTEARPHSRLHQCRGLRGAFVPFLPAGTKAKVSVNDWEDYVGDEIAQTDAFGRPVMSVTVERNDGQDCWVFAPTARGELAHA